MKIKAEIKRTIREHNERNAALLREMTSKGIAIDREFSIEHHFWSGTQMKAAKLAQELYKRDFLVIAISRVNADNGSEWWNVEAVKGRKIEDIVRSQITEELVRLAADYDSIYDGWGASI
jgi:regulator of RNase E activity RraB